MERGAVADSGPLIALGKVNHLEILRATVGAILIPPQVERELLVRRSIESERIARAASNWLQMRTPALPTEIELSATSSLDRGEAEAIWLAHQRGLPLVMDEAKGRVAAKSLTIAVIGSVGILLEAKRLHLLVAVMPVLWEMRNHGYWLADSLLRRAAEIAGESWLP